MSKFTRSFRNSFLAGLAIIAPLAVTAFVLQFIFTKLTGVLQPLIDEIPVEYTGEITTVAQVLAVIILFVFIVVIGFIARWSFGQRAFKEFDEFMSNVPVVRTIYSSVRQVSNALMDSQNQYDKVVLVEWTGEETYLLGFVTNKSPKAARDKIGKDVYNVFLPMSPNPMTGRLALIPDEKLIEIDMTVKRGLQTLITSGMTSDDDTIEVPGEEIETEEVIENIDKKTKVDEKVKEKVEEIDNDEDEGKDQSK